MSKCPTVRKRDTKVALHCFLPYVVTVEIEHSWWMSGSGAKVYAHNPA